MNKIILFILFFIISFSTYSQTKLQNNGFSITLNSDDIVFSKENIKIIQPLSIFINLLIPQKQVILNYQTELYMLQFLQIQNHKLITIQ